MQRRNMSHAPLSPPAKAAIVSQRKSHGFRGLGRCWQEDGLKVLGIVGGARTYQGSGPSSLGGCCLAANLLGQSSVLYSAVGCSVQCAVLFLYCM